MRNEGDRSLLVTDALFNDADEAVRGMDIRRAVRSRLVNRGPRRRIMRVALAATPVLTAVVALVVLTYPKPPSAFAGWRPMPEEADAQLTEMAAECAGEYAFSNGASVDMDLLLMDRRGRAAIAFAAGTTSESSASRFCLYAKDPANPDGPWRHVGGGGGGGSNAGSQSPWVGLQTPYPQDVWLTGVGNVAGVAEDYIGTPVSWALGQVGEDVERVRVHVDGLATIEATVENGWFVTWWPARSSTWPVPWGWTTDLDDITVEAFDENGQLVYEGDGRRHHALHTSRG